MKQELQDQAVTLGRKLGFFIHSLDASDEVKQAWLAILEQMTLKQLGELTEVLETRFLDEQTRKVDEEFSAALAKILRESDEEQSKS